MSEKAVTGAKRIGEFIREARRIHGMTQKQLGEKLGIDQRTVSSLERNPGSVSLARIVEVLLILGLTVSINVGAKKS